MQPENQTPKITCLRELIYYELLEAGLLVDEDAFEISEIINLKVKEWLKQGGN